MSTGRCVKPKLWGEPGRFMSDAACIASILTYSCWLGCAHQVTPVIDFADELPPNAAELRKWLADRLPR